MDDNKNTTQNTQTSILSPFGDTPQPISPTPDTVEEKPAFLSADATPPSDPPATGNTFVVTPPSGNNFTKSKFAAMIGIVVLLVGIGTSVALVGTQQLTRTRAWDCGHYVFNVSQTGSVTLDTTGNTRNSEPAQAATVFINGNNVRTFQIPQVSPNQQITLGDVTVPTDGNFTWRVEGALDCESSGRYGGQTTQGSIRVCKVIEKCGQVMSNWTTLPSTSFSVTVRKPNSNYTETVNFSTLENPNTTLANGMAANCKQLTGPITRNTGTTTTYFYTEETISPAHSSWTPVKYNDGYIDQSINSFYTYGDFEGNVDADGYILLTDSRPDRTLAILNGQKCSTSTPTPTPTASPSPTPTGNVTAQCVEIKAFDANWNQLTTSDLTSLEAGDVIRLTVKGLSSGGTFDKARFTINGNLRAEVTQKRPSTQEFYDEYTIPAGTTTFNVQAEIHSVQLNQWFK